MEAGLDSGPMIDEQIFKLWFSDTVADLITKIKEHTPSWSLDSIDCYVHGELEEKIQDGNHATYCSKIVKEDGQIDIFLDSVEDIYRKYKAYFLWPKISAKLKIRNWELKIIVIDYLLINEELYHIHKNKPLYDGKYINPAIIECKIKPEGSRSMSWGDFVRWYL